LELGEKGPRKCKVKTRKLVCTGPERIPQGGPVHSKGTIKEHHLELERCAGVALTVKEVQTENEEGVITPSKRRQIPQLDNVRSESAMTERMR